MLHLGNEYNSNWRQIWSSNHHIPNPDDLEPYTVVELGPKYTTREGDDLHHLADRFATSPELILSVNPQIVDASLIVPDRELCVLPGICDDDQVGNGKFEWSGNFA